MRLQEETDELLLFDEELMDVDPEYLPRRVLTDFTIYNAEVGGLQGWETWKRTEYV